MLLILTNFYIIVALTYLYPCCCPLPQAGTHPHGSAGISPTPAICIRSKGSFCSVLLLCNQKNNQNDQKTDISGAQIIELKLFWNIWHKLCNPSFSYLPCTVSTGHPSCSSAKNQKYRSVEHTIWSYLHLWQDLATEVQGTGTSLTSSLNMLSGFSSISQGRGAGPVPGPSRCPSPLWGA